MKYWPLVAIPLSWILQVLLAARFGPINAIPDILLLLAAFSGLLMGPDAGAAMGFFAGLLQDISFGRYIGVHALSRAACGFVSGYAGKRVLPDSLAVPFLVGFGATLLDDLVSFVIFGVAGAGTFVLRRQMLVLTASAYNALLGPLAFMLVSRLSSGKPTQGKM